MGVKERLQRFLRYKKISQAKFEKRVQLSNGFVDSIGKSIRGESLEKILKEFPELNKTWLMLDEGEMLLPQPQIVDIQEKSGGISKGKVKKAASYAKPQEPMVLKEEINCENCKKLKCKIEYLEELLNRKDEKKDVEIARLNKEIGRLEQQLNGKKGEARCV